MDSSGEIRVSGYSLESRINEVFSLEGEDFNIYLYICLKLKSNPCIICVTKIVALL